MRKLCMMVLCLLLMVSCAQAAQLITNGVSVTGAEIPISAVSPTGGASAVYLLDDDPSTSWERSSSADSSMMDIILVPASSSLEAIWIRSGNCASRTMYEACARPDIIKVSISSLQGDVYTNTSYRYAMTDVYNPDVTSALWQSGYQCLMLPEPIYDVQTISITVESYHQGKESSDVHIADILLAPSSESVIITPAVTAAPSTQAPSTSYQPIDTTLLMRLATRSGPSTQYDELGSYFKAGHSIRVLSLCYDNGGVPWVQVEFTYKNRLRRAYTGLKRVDVDEARLPREELLAYATADRQVTPRFGPGTQYEARNLTVYAGQYGSIYAYENGWAQFEYYDDFAQLYRRVWISVDDLIIH